MKNDSRVWKLKRLLKKALFRALKYIALLIGQKFLLRKQTEMQKETCVKHETQDRMNEFLALVNHELKTPLTSIKGNVQLLTRKLRHAKNFNGAGSEEMVRLFAEEHELLERTEQQINRLTLLLNTLLEGARISSNTPDLLTDLCELDTLVREVVQDHRYVPPTRTIHLTLPDEKTLIVMADQVRIKQAIIHYVANAHRYSPLDHPIEVYLEEEGKMARLSVRDEGPGIASNEQKHIWERYYRISGINPLNGGEVGLGLGLHISRTIIEQHHGQVGVISTPGNGSLFWFTLPLYSAQPRQPAQSPQSDQASSTGHGDHEGAPLQ